MVQAAANVLSARILTQNPTYDDWAREVLEAALSVAPQPEIAYPGHYKDCTADLRVRGTFCKCCGCFTLDTPDAPQQEIPQTGDALLHRVTSVTETTDPIKVNEGLAGGYILLSCAADPHGGMHYCLGTV